MVLTSRIGRSDAPSAPRVGVAIVTGSCCNPHMPPFDAEAKRVVAQAVAESGVSAEVREVPATKAFFGVGVPRHVLAEVIRLMNEEGKVGLPAVFINGEVISYGIPTVECVRAALERAVGQRPETQTGLASAAPSTAKE